jgi:RHS repeat-associated protein
LQGWQERTSYLNTYYTWEGKQLKSIGGYCKSFAYFYNDEGIRVSKKLNGCGQNETINYLLSGDKVFAEINTTNSSKNLYYTYDVDGSLISFTYQGIEYFYIKNIQGDIIKIIDATGVVKVSYQYDAYGNMVITDHSSNNLGTINPYRYRGYRYDEESKLYYLQSRYYNPEIQRFISLDDISYLDPSQSTGLNLYAYTGNNPVMFVDPSGNFWDYVIDFISIVWSAYDFWNNPSWANAGWLALDVVFAVVPVLTGSSALKAYSKTMILLILQD